MTIDRDMQYQMSLMADYPYGKIYDNANCEALLGQPVRHAARQLLYEMEQRHDDEISERHHHESLEQEKAHHIATLEQQAAQFRHTIRVAKTSNMVAIVAALAAIVAAWFAGEAVQESKSQPVPQQLQSRQQEQTSLKASPSLAPSAKSLPFSTSSHAVDSPSKTLSPTSPNTSQ